MRSLSETTAFRQGSDGVFQPQMYIHDEVEDLKRKRKTARSRTRPSQPTGYMVLKPTGDARRYTVLRGSESRLAVEERHHHDAEVDARAPSASTSVPKKDEFHEGHATQSFPLSPTTYSSRSHALAGTVALAELPQEPFHYQLSPPGNALDSNVPPYVPHSPVENTQIAPTWSGVGRQQPFGGSSQFLQESSDEASFLSGADFGQPELNVNVNFSPGGGADIGRADTTLSPISPSSTNESMSPFHFDTYFYRHPHPHPQLTTMQQPCGCTYVFNITTGEWIGTIPARQGLEEYHSSQSPLNEYMGSLLLSSPLSPTTGDAAGQIPWSRVAGPSNQPM